MPDDYNGDGKADYATYQPSSGRWAVAGGTANLWGGSGNIPLPLPPYAIRNLFFPLAPVGGGPLTVLAPVVSGLFGILG